MGDPIDTIGSLLYSLHVAQARAIRWKKEREGDWKALALITVSYDEWGLGNEAEKFLEMQL